MKEKATAAEDQEYAKTKQRESDKENEDNDDDDDSGPKDMLGDEEDRDIIF